MAIKTEFSSDYIAELYSQGKSVASIADETGLPASKVYQALRSMDVQMRTRGGKGRVIGTSDNLSPMELFATLAMYAYGKTAAQAGEWLDIPRSTAGEAARRGVMKLRARGLQN
jgi:DNA-directed RNA polymerase specialized sigma24 family protein